MKLIFTSLFFNRGRLRSSVLISIFLLAATLRSGAEGSKDLIKYPGKRLFLWAEKQQQIKVYAAEGEFINIGSSHVGIEGGFIRVFRPDGSLHTVFDNTGDLAGKAIINNNIEELNGPVGGGIGYEPGVISVAGGEQGIWTVTFEYPSYLRSDFSNLWNNAAWTRAADQPTNRRVVLAWDVTISQNAPANEGGNMITGRVYSKEYHSIMNRNGATSSPTFYVLSKIGFQYEVKFNHIDPWGFPIHSNNVGLVNGNQNSIYKSVANGGYDRSDDPDSWLSQEIYLYEPQAQDYGRMINNKVFFNIPDENMPKEALTTDIWRNNPHITWLFNNPDDAIVSFEDFRIKSSGQDGSSCIPNTLQPGESGYFVFSLDESGEVELNLDFNNNGIFTDAVDRTIVEYSTAGIDSIFWDGKDGEGNFLPLGFNQEIGYNLSLRAGEIHVMLSDVENDHGGMTIQLINDIGIPNPDYFYYDHSGIGGDISGGGTTVSPTNEGYIFNFHFGNEKLLDYWAYVPFDGTIEADIPIQVLDDCLPPDYPDTDQDGIVDLNDIDDDNDGIPDKNEFCNPDGSTFACLPGGFDPGGDEDLDGILNFKDADDTAFINGCLDANADGICDSILSIYDTDGDGVPDHLDLDSDNDGITDLAEAGHLQPDVNGDGIIDGAPVEFGLNGLYNPIASDSNDLAAFAIYDRYDTDADGVPDHDDLDSDNDGINDVREANLQDENNDGIIGLSAPIVDVNGLAISNQNNLPIHTTSSPVNTDMDLYPDFRDNDTDNDGIFDTHEANNPDQDNDGFIGKGTPTVNRNGQPISDADGQRVVTISNPIDRDMDGIADFQDIDRDNDGIADSYECESWPCVDTDGDGKLDIDDMDSDGDLISDEDECSNGANCPDDNNNNIDNFREYTCAPVNTPVIVNITPDQEICELESIFFSGNNNLHITDSVTYSWSGPDGFSFSKTVLSTNDFTVDIQNANQNKSGQFTLTVISDKGCSSTPESVNLTVNEIPGKPILDVSDDLLCTSETLELTTTSFSGNSVTYEWFFNKSGSSSKIAANTLPFHKIDLLRPDQTGDYSVQIINSNCKSEPSDTKYVEINDAPSIDPPVNTSTADSPACEGNDISLEVNSIPGATYSWTGPNGYTSSINNPILENVTIQDKGEYFVEVSRDGCNAAVLSTEVFIIEQPEQPILNQPAPVCIGEDVVFFIKNPIIAPGKTVEYFWYSNVAGNLIATTNVPTLELTNLTIDQAGQITAAVGVNGCYSPVSDDVTLSVNDIFNASSPTNSTTTDAPACEGEDVIMTAEDYPGATYIWSGPNGFNQTGPIGLITNISTDNAGEYFVEISLNGCTVTTPATTVFVSEKPETPKIEKIPPICEGNNASIHITNPVVRPGSIITYDWYNATSNQLIATTNIPELDFTNITIGDAGGYYVITKINGCPSDVSDTEDLIVIQGINPATPTNTTSETSPACEGDDVIITATNYPGATYNWTGPNGFTETTPSPMLSEVTISDAGEYYVVIEKDGCISTSPATEVFINPLPEQPILTTPDTICEGSDVNVSVMTPTGSGITYEWYDSVTGDLVSITSAPILELTNVNSTAAYYAITKMAGCASEKSETRIVTVDEIPNETAFIQNDMIFSCSDEEVSLSATSPVNSTGIWTAINSGIILQPELASTMAVDLEPGENHFVWTLSNGNCLNFSTDTVTAFHEEINAQAIDDSFILGMNQDVPSAAVLVNDNFGDVRDIAINITMAPTSGKININQDGTFIYSPNNNFTGEDQFKYEICNLNCPDQCTEATVNIRIIQEDSGCFIPNFITPNQDGANDNFEIQCLSSEFPDNEITIFNRRGDVVHKAAPYRNDWNGEWRNTPLPPGTYFYCLKKTPEAEAETGFVTLIR